jgi:hypothetical protein
MSQEWDATKTNSKYSIRNDTTKIPNPPQAARGAPATGASGSSKGQSFQKPTSWSPAVEDVYRLQSAGWDTLDEYIGAYGEPQRWEVKVKEFNYI